MTVQINKPTLGLASLLARLSGLERRIAGAGPNTVGHSGDGATTRFACTRGFRPGVVWSDGLMQREGAGGTYSVVADGGAFSVVFATAPSSGVRIDIQQWRDPSLC